VNKKRDDRPRRRQISGHLESKMAALETLQQQPKTAPTSCFPRHWQDDLARDFPLSNTIGTPVFSFCAAEGRHCPGRRPI
jgi:hypothetical protein